MTHASRAEPPATSAALGGEAPLLGIATWVGLVGLLLREYAPIRSVDLDVFHAMSLFREALASGRLPMDDAFAYTPTIAPVVHHEWGTGAVLYAFWEGMGWGPLGVSVLRYAVVAALLVLAWACARRRGATLASIALCGFPALLMLKLGLAPVRGQMFTFVLVALLLLLLEVDRRGARWWIPAWLALSVVWVNLHGGFVVGCGIVALTVVDRFASRAREGLSTAGGTVRHLVFVLAAMGAVLLLTPYRAAYPHRLWQALTMPRPLVSEWAALWDPRVEPALVGVYALSLAFVAYAIWKDGARLGSGFPVVVVLGAAAALSQRHVALYAIAWFTWVAPALARTELGHVVARWYSRFPLQVVAVGILCALGGVARTAANRSWELVVPDVATERAPYPVHAVDYLERRSFSGNLMTWFDDGSYVSWRLHPAVKVSLDSRYEAAFPPGLLLEHVQFFEAAPGWERVLTRYPTDAVLVPRAAPVAAALDASPAVSRTWKRAYGDASHLVYVRADRLATLAAAP